GAAVRVIAPQLHSDIQALATQITLEQRPATAAEVFAADSLLVLATDNAELNAALVESGRRQGCLVCRVDDTQDNDFIFPAVIDRSPLLVSVSTQGASPALTRHVKQRLEAFLPQDYRQLGTYVEQLRERVKALLQPAERAAFWRRWMNSMAPELILGRQSESAASVTEKLLAGDET